MSSSALESAFIAQCARLGLPPPAREYVFAPPRKWRFDAAWPELMLAVEIDGGVHSGGRHTRGAGFERDNEKINTAVLLGWAVLRFSAASLNDGTAARLTQVAIAQRMQKAAA